MTKKVLITGKDSYIGTSFIKYCESNQAGFEIDELETRGEEWQKYDFSKYDTVLHVAGIAHIKETKENERLYYEVNRDLAIEIAERVKKSGIKQFVFLSTMSVYSKSEGTITEDTPLTPKNAYGKSKLLAENHIKQMADPNFKVAIIRPPMIYGPNCKGNYQTLSKFAKKTKIFPQIENQRSMLYIDNLSEFFVRLINQNQNGLFFPQNKEYVATSEMIKEIADIYNNKMILTTVFNPLIKVINSNLFKKVFGNLVYDQKLSNYVFDYQVVDFSESIEATENG